VAVWCWHSTVCGLCVCICSYNNLRHTFPWLSDAGIQLCVVCVCVYVTITIYDTRSRGCLMLAFNCVWSVCVCVCSYNNLRHTFPWLSDAGIQLCVVRVCVCVCSYNNLWHTFPWLSDAGIQLCVVRVCVCVYVVITIYDTHSRGCLMLAFDCSTTCSCTTQHAGQSLTVSQLSTQLWLAYVVCICFALSLQWYRVC